LRYEKSFVQFAFFFRKTYDALIEQTKHDIEQELNDVDHHAGAVKPQIKQPKYKRKERASSVPPPTVTTSPHPPLAVVATKPAFKIQSPPAEETVEDADKEKSFDDVGGRDEEEEQKHESRPSEASVEELAEEASQGLEQQPASMQDYSSISSFFEEQPSRSIDDSSAEVSDLNK
jgi:hypothetical protein